MCRVIAPLAAIVRRETVSRPSLLPPLLGAPPSMRAIFQRRLRIVRHRVLRWFGEPIAIVERKRRESTSSVWRYDFRPRAVRHYQRLDRAAKHVA
jgi:hypothetical protein